jgi:radical SAM protein with 4Fe4S-binding SPASM domain
MNRLGSFVYRIIHTNGFAADVSYSTARVLERMWMRLSGWRATLNKVRPEELWDYRHIATGGTLVLGVTNICNAKCVFCAYPKALANNNLQTGVMPFDIFKKAVDEWVALGGQNIDLTYMVGDPLVDPGLMDKIAYARNQTGIKRISLTTNGILLNRNETYRQLIDLRVNEIYISTQGTNKKAFEEVYGVNQYDNVISGVRNLLQYNRDKGEPTVIGIRFRNAQKPSDIIRARDFVENIKPYLSQKVRHNFTVAFDNWGGLVKESDMIGAMHLRKPLVRTDVPCTGLLSFLVRYDGSVRLCGCRFKRSDMDEMVVGNIRQQTLMEISSGQKAWNIIKEFYSATRPETCIGCTFYHPVTRSWFRNRVFQSKEALARVNAGKAAVRPASEAEHS